MPASSKNGKILFRKSLGHKGKQQCGGKEGQDESRTKRQDIVQSKIIEVMRCKKTAKKKPHEGGLDSGRGGQKA